MQAGDLEFESSQHPPHVWVWLHMRMAPAGEGGSNRKILIACWPTILTQAARFRCSKRLCLKRIRQSNKTQLSHIYIHTHDKHTHAHTHLQSPPLLGYVTDTGRKVQRSHPSYPRQDQQLQCSHTGAWRGHFILKPQQGNHSYCLHQWICLCTKCGDILSLAFASCVYGASVLF